MHSLDLILLLKNFFIVMGFLSTLLLILAFLFKAKGIKLFEFFPESKDKLSRQENISYNIVSNSKIENKTIESKKIAAIISAIEYHKKYNL